jgi:thioesterase domain-containing protein/acyl carrier protein
MVREDQPGDQQLVAYLATSTDVPPSVSKLRQYLTNSVPNTPLPGRFVTLDQLPLDRNGKIDKRALPAPGRQRPHLHRPYVKPATFRQALIAKCFAETLGLNDVGLHDNFFELGGDSLHATNLLLLLEQNLGIRCPPRFLYAAGTVAAIDQDIKQDLRPAYIVAMRADGALPPLFCMHDSHGHVLGYRRLAQLLGPDRPVYGVQAYDLDKLPRRGMRLEEIACRYVQEIRQVQPSGPYYLCGQCFGGLVAFETARQLSEQGERIALLALIDTRFPYKILGQLAVRLARAWRWLRESRLSTVETLEFLSDRLYGFREWARNSIAVRTRLGATRLAAKNGCGTVHTNMSALDASRLIESRYKPKPYFGTVTLICPGVPHNQRGWERVASRGLDIIEIPVAVESYDPPILVQERYVAELADTLRLLLQERVDTGN